ncbi:hypothetical protein LCGC14_0566980 [marine sediment metagenome]|uniref:Bacteriophage Mu GpT domain-containing protein n=1 Tax=marine sediment metagenome TaxID=412755 RepID=A0A0F9U6P9_9ZZZZ
MAASIAQWDTDYFDQFKMIFPTSFSNLQIYPSNPIAFINRVGMAFGLKQAQRNIRLPNQRIQVGKEVTYQDKDVPRVPQKADMPALWDSIRVSEEDYAGDVVNALGHVSDLFENFQSGIADFVYTGTPIDPLAYGLIDPGAGTGSTTITRPDICVQVTTAGKWDIPSKMFLDLAQADTNLTNKGFFGQRRILAPQTIKPFLNHVLTSTTTPYRDWISQIAGYPITFTPLVDPDALITAFDVYMVDETAFDLFMTPLKVRGYFENNTEYFVWHWKTRAYLLPRPKNDGTDWFKAIVKIHQVDFTT